MNRRLALLLVLSLGLLAASARPTFDVGGGTPAAVRTQSPVAFEPNQGQAPDGVQFVTHHGSTVTYVTASGTTTALGNQGVTVSLIGAEPAAFSGTEQRRSVTNYLVGNDRAKWRTGIPNFGRITAASVYPGIDLTYYGTGSSLEHDFVVAPGADYRQIALSVSGHDGLALDDSGNLVMTASGQTLTLKAPVSYQGSGHTNHTVPSRFELDGDTVTVTVGDAYDPTKPLVIDPAFIFASTLGGSGDDIGNAIAVDKHGNIYMAGNTASSDLAYGWPSGSLAGDADGFIVKFDPIGIDFPTSDLIAATYIGGDGDDDGINSLALDPDGNVYITGQTDSTDFPVQDAYQGSLAGITNAFAMKLDTDLSTILYATYLGGSLVDQGRNIAAAADGSFVVAGIAGSTDFPVESPYQPDNAGGADIFITRFEPDGQSLTYSTYLGGSGDDKTFAPSMGLDADGNVYLGGTTTSADYPTESPYQGSSAGGTGDLFISKLAADGQSLAYSTYLGGSGDDGVNGGDLAIDTDGNAYITAGTDSTDFPMASAEQPDYGGGTSDAVVVKLDASGSYLAYSTYLGGNGRDLPNGIAVAPDGCAWDSGYPGSCAYVTGSTDSTNWTSYSVNSGGTDLFLTKLTPYGTWFATDAYSQLLTAAFSYNAGDDSGSAVAVSLDGNAYVTGYTTSDPFYGYGGWDSASHGGTDAILLGYTEHDTVVHGMMQPLLSFDVSPLTCDLGTFSISQTNSCTHTMEAGSNSVSGYAVSYVPTATLTSGGNTIDAMASQSDSTPGTEQFGMNLVANTAAGSNTATDFGADPSGGSGTAAADYGTADQFKFLVGGDTVAEATGPSDTTTFTASFIGNIGVSTEAGTYSTPVTYVITASY